jgi:hypothetical protein
LNGLHVEDHDYEPHARLRQTIAVTLSLHFVARVNNTIEQEIFVGANFRMMDQSALRINSKPRPIAFHVPSETWHRLD